jgi:hypothetical protein
MKKHLLFIAFLLLGLTTLSACHTAIPFHRSLPDWVRRVYVPIAQNGTTDAGLETLVTNAFTEATLSDGRLEVVSKAKADAVVQIRLDKMEKSTRTFSSDDVEASRELLLTYSVDLYDPADMQKPFAYIHKAEMHTTYTSDLRSLGGISNVQGRADLATATGKAILNDVLFKLRTGAPEEMTKSSGSKTKKKS